MRHQASPQGPLPKILTGNIQKFLLRERAK
jgi:hypothetical protein